MITIRAVRPEDLVQWSRLWQEYWEDNKYVIRSHDVAYYEYRCFNNKYTDAFCCLDENGNTIGFCGIGKRELIRHGRRSLAAEFTDFIFDPRYRMRGHVKEFARRLFSGALARFDWCVFYPVNRESFITWRFMFKFDRMYEINKWALLLEYEERDVQEIGYECVEQVSLNAPCIRKNSAYLQWRYFKHPSCYKLVGLQRGGRTAGYFTYLEVEIDGIFGVEIGGIYYEDIAKTGYKGMEMCLDSIVAFIKSRGSKFMILQALKGCGWDRYLANWERSKKTFEKKYALLLNMRNFNRGLKPKKEVAPDAFALLGEELDAPREVSFVTKIL